MQEIKSAGDRAASLTTQLLAFSRRQVLQPKVIDLNLIVADFDRMLRRVVGERIQVVIDCAPDLWHGAGRPRRNRSRVMNLSLNARDAMPGDGTLTIQTANLTLAESEAREQGLQPGRHVILEVRDTGVGMDEHMQDAHLRAFLYHQGNREGNRSWPGHRAGDRGAKRRQHPVPVRAWARAPRFRIFLPAVAEPAQQRPRLPAGLPSPRPAAPRPFSWWRTTIPFARWWEES